MRIPFAAFLTMLAVFAASQAAAAAAPPAPRRAAPAVQPTPRPSATVAPAIAEQLSTLKRLERAQLRTAYADAQLELARRYQSAGDGPSALAAARAASQAFDRQVEVHKTLSETLMPYERARAERASAHDLGVQRDRANFLAGEIARSIGEDDLAITHYVLVIQSQPDQPLGQEALAALVTMGFAAPSPTPTPKKP